MQNPDIMKRNDLAHAIDRHVYHDYELKRKRKDRDLAGFEQHISKKCDAVYDLVRNVVWPNEVYYKPLS